MTEIDPAMPPDEATAPLERHHSGYRPSRRYHLSGATQKHYQQQYGDIYFLRLARLKPAVEAAAAAAWAGFAVGGERASRKARVLDVRQGELCWVAGTVYMDLPLKPNVLEDLALDRGVAAPPPRQTYKGPSGQDRVMLEDESGRLQLAGALLEDATLVTGCIVAVLGTEKANGEFEVLDLKVPDLPEQPPRRKGGDDGAPAAQNGDGADASTGGYVALVSGLGISGDEADSITLGLLAQYLLGEVGGPSDQRRAARVSRLVVAGDALARPPPPDESAGAPRRPKKYGYDAAAYNPAPTALLDRWLAALLPSLPVTLLPGAADPAGVALPQQPLHTALFPRARVYASHPQATEPGWFDTTTNPWEGDVDGWRFLGNAGQPISDIFKYVEGEDRLHMMESVLRWRIHAPTAPDTLCESSLARTKGLGTC